MSKWLDVVVSFRKVIQWLDSKHEFNYEAVCEFQRDGDEFCDRYIELTGIEGMTNYIHLLHAGHFAFFMLEFGNLYRYSQQGWENINSIMKRSFHQNTQKGGSKKDVGTSKIQPIFFRLARGMLWRFGYLDGLFHAMGWKDDFENIRYGEVKRMPKYKHKEIEAMEKYANTIFKAAEEDGFDDMLLDFLDEDIDFGTGTGMDWLSEISEEMDTTD